MSLLLHIYRHSLRNSLLTAAGSLRNFHCITIYLSIYLSMHIYIYI